MAEISPAEFIRQNSSIEKIAAEVRELAAEKSQALKKFKELGGHARARKEAVYLSRLDTAERISYINTLFTYLQVMQVPASEQLSFLQQLDPNQPTGDDTYRQMGHMVAARGGDRSECLYDVTSGPGIFWNMGFDEGLAVRDAEIADANVRLIKAGIKATVAAPEAAPVALDDDADAAPPPAAEPPPPQGRSRRRKQAAPEVPAAVPDAEPVDEPLGDAGPDGAAEPLPGDEPSPPEETPAVVDAAGVLVKPEDSPMLRELMRRRAQNRRKAGLT